MRVRTTICLVSILICLIVRSAIAADSAASRPTMAVVMDAFDQAIVQGQGRISKWPLDRPVIVKVTAAFGPAETAALETAMTTIRQQTKLVLRRNDAAADPQITIETVDDLGSPGEGAHNLGRTHSIYKGVSGEMSSAVVSILRTLALTDPNRFRHTIVHEMFHAVGFYGHAPMSFDSIMRPTRGAEVPTLWDLMFLNVLYDEKMPLGTPRTLVLPIACRLLQARLAAMPGKPVLDLQRTRSQPVCVRLDAAPIAIGTAGERIAYGWAYLNGYGVPRNLDEAQRIARQSKAFGDRDADYLLYLISQASPR